MLPAADRALPLHTVRVRPTSALFHYADVEFLARQLQQTEALAQSTLEVQKRELVAARAVRPESRLSLFVLTLSVALLLILSRRPP